MSVSGQDVAVLGAGIGGLAAATALAQRGASVRVYEQAPELAEVGAGIQISANGLTVLRGLGIPVDAASVEGQGTELQDFRAGRTVLRVPPPAEGKTRFFHRADLLDLLVSAAQQAGVRIHLGQRAVSATASGTVSFDGEADVSAHLIVGADGVRGVTRKVLSGGDAPRFTGQVAWRAVVPWDGQADPRAFVQMGPGRHVVTYPLRGGAAMNVAAFEDRRGWTEESWRREGDIDEFRTRFGQFGGRAGEAIGQAGLVHTWALHLHPVARVWAGDRLALIGDAAHPTLPYLAQGACLALEDAWVLAASLDRHDDLSPGLAAYEALRVTRARRVVQAASKNAWRFHLRAPFRQIGQAMLRAAGPRAAPDFGWIYALDVTAD